jgi:hypothetical protein
MITSSGSQRFDLYAGPFTKNDQLTSSPFANAFLYIPNVTYSVASQVAPLMNNKDSNNRRDLSVEEREEELYRKGYVGKRFRRWLEDMDKRAQEETQEKPPASTLGYVTTDVRLTLSYPSSFCDLLRRIAREWETTRRTNLWLSIVSLISSSRIPRLM